MEHPNLDPDVEGPPGHEGRPDVRFCKLFQVWNWYLVLVIWKLFSLARAKINPHEILSQFQVLKYPPILIDFKFSKLLRFLEISRIYYVLSGQAIRPVRDRDRMRTALGTDRIRHGRGLTWTASSVKAWDLSKILFMVLQKIDKNLEKSWKNWDNACWAEILVWEWSNCRLWLIYEGFKPSQDTKLPIFIFWDLF